MTTIRIESQQVPTDELRAWLDIWRDAFGGQSSFSVDGLTHPENYAVYTLRCEPRAENFHDYCKTTIGRYPNWATAALQSHSCFYVGITSDIERRLSEHISGSKRASVFTRVFEPVEIVDVKFRPKHQQAKQLELDTADRLREVDGYFVPVEVIK